MESSADPAALAELAAAINLQRGLAKRARADLEAAIPILVSAIKNHSGQSLKIESLLWSVWGGELCDALAGLDTKLAQTVIAMIAARAHLSGDADGMLYRIIAETGSRPPQPVQP
jgi:hypothetical protein